MEVRQYDIEGGYVEVREDGGEVEVKIVVTLDPLLYNRVIRYCRDSCVSLDAGDPKNPKLVVMLVECVEEG
jgi:hypothetical protein